VGTFNVGMLSFAGVEIQVVPLELPMASEEEIIDAYKQHMEFANVRLVILGTLSHVILVELIV
jgi:hypothetical protein